MEPNILILGLDDAGKTTLLNYLNQDVKNVKPTLGVNAQTINFCGITLNVYDLGGQNAIREYWQYYYENIDGLVYVIDASEEERMEECNELFQQLLKEEKLKNVPVLVYANKADLDNCLSTDTIKKKIKNR